ncbi:MAG: alpha/beta hydrolase [Planctomycetota bacterium]
MKPRSLILLPLLALVALSPARADQRVTLKSGLTLQGLLVDIPTLSQSGFQAGGQGQVKSRPILLVDDGLRRVYIHRRGMVAGEPQDVRGVEQSLDFDQLVPLSGNQVQGIGDILSVSPFNRYGRRSITVRGPKGSPLTLIQGITELNARYAKIEALRARRSYAWDMRVATSTIPSSALLTMFEQWIDQDDFDQRLEVVRFFIESRRFGDAESELKRVMKDFPDQPAMDAQLIGIVSQQASQLVQEAKQRASVGQEAFARRVYDGFPLGAVGRTMRLSVSDEIRRLDDNQREIEGLLSALRKDIETLPEDERNANLEQAYKEIVAGLSSATLARLSDYNRLRDSKNVAVDARVSLAVAGWLLGPGSGEQNLLVATSLVKVRDLVAEYLGPADLVRRRAILEELQTIEGSQIEYVARLLPLLVPVKPWPEGSEDAEVPGFHRVANPDGPSYLVQLPPEYDPRREYPCLLVLAPPGAKPELELAWWAGDYDQVQKARSGHAMRNGYIVVSPQWSRDTQRVYEYTPREHHAVLSALRDAMRRCSIDADRVFLSGHGDGATAAWDIALSHPDQWAGMVSINGEPAKTIKHYFPNARTVPLYFVMGERSGPTPPLSRMGAVLDDYMHVRNDATVVMYQGRGREHFYEEIPEIFQWLNAATHVRKPCPPEFETKTIRSGDQYFWWLELGPLKSGVDLNPVLWDHEEKRKRAGTIKGAIRQGNRLNFSGPTDSFTLWLRPESGLNLNEQVVISMGNRSPKRFDFDGSLETLLEDVRQRADRKRPFWAKVSVP